MWKHKWMMDERLSCSVFGHPHAICFQARKMYVMVGHPWQKCSMCLSEGLEWVNWPQIHVPHPVCISWVWGEEATLLLTSWGCSLPWALLVGCGHTVTVALWCRSFKMLTSFGRECLSPCHSSPVYHFWDALCCGCYLLFLLLGGRCDAPHPKTTNSWRKLILLWAHPVAKFACLENHMKWGFPLRWRMDCSMGG